MPDGTAPPPIRNPNNTAKDIAILLRWGGKIIERITKDVGNKQDGAAA